MNYDIEVYDTEADTIKKVPMSEDQVEAVDAIIAGEHDIYRLCGGAGVGKSAVIAKITEELDSTVTATTARAALNVGGCTVDSTFAFRRNTWKVNHGRLQHNMNECGEWIIIDEASMIGTRMATCIYDAVCEFGKKLILVGDWAQAPPVKDTWPVNHPLMESGVSLKLTTNHRQGAGPYLDCLKEIRAGEVSARSQQLFSQRVAKCPQDDLYTYMYGTNRAADNHNTMRFQHLLKQTRCPPVTPKAEYKPNHEFAPDKPEYIENILRDSRLSYGVRYCVGAKVMLTMNQYGLGFVNGDIGYITAYFSAHDDLALLEDLQAAQDKEVPARDVFMQRYDEPIGKHIVGFVVRLDRNGREVLVPTATEEVLRPDGKPFYSVSGLPIRLAYALTVHKMQGATLDRAYLAMNSLWDEHGIAYVGLSRTRSIEGLLLESWRPDYIKCDPTIIKYL